MKQLSKEQIETQRKAWNKIIAKAWSDSNFKQKLLNEPQKVLKEHGIDTQTGMEIRIFENTNKVTYLILPEKPEGELFEEALRALSAASGCQQGGPLNPGSYGCGQVG
jgi:hypothetical protein